MAEISTGDIVNIDNPDFEIVSAGNTPANPGSGHIIYDGTNLKINVAGPDATPVWKTITIS